MSKMTEFDRSALRALRVDIDSALIAVGAKHGIRLSTGNARFTADSATFKLECSLFNSDGVAESKEMVALKECYPELVNKRITFGRGTNGFIIGYNPRAHQYPFLVKTVKGVYKITALQAIGLEGSRPGSRSSTNE
ncbi:hypothetical protein LCGC14_1548390 [marine sediment metagenome]|uniref:Uncharacterized protein n=1 Tax=marine sediment metagenome TaxID=412755 RepID=A0A0F9LRX5_9ZZZZ